MLAQTFDVEPNDVAYLEILWAIKRRLRAVEALARDASDPHFPPEDREAVVAATRQLAQLFDPARQGVPWTQSRAECIREKDAFALANFSPVAKAMRPLRRLTEADLNAITEHIDRALAQLEAEGGVDAWIKAEIADGLSRLRLMIRLLPFFGHELALEQIITVAAKATALAKHGAGVRRALAGIFAVLAAAGTAFTVPHELLEAARDYSGLYLQWVEPPRLEHETPARGDNDPSEAAPPAAPAPERETDDPRGLQDTQQA